MTDYVNQHCAPCEGGVPALTPEQVSDALKGVTGWLALAGSKAIERLYEFRTYDETMAFVNAVAWIARREDHHPDLEVGYRQVRVRYATHAIGGLSDNDFICAAKINALLH